MPKKSTIHFKQTKWKSYSRVPVPCQKNPQINKHKQKGCTLIR